MHRCPDPGHRRRGGHDFRAPQKDGRWPGGDRGVDPSLAEGRVSLRPFEGVTQTAMETGATSKWWRSWKMLYQSASCHGPRGKGDTDTGSIQGLFRYVPLEPLWQDFAVFACFPAPVGLGSSCWCPTTMRVYDLMDLLVPCFDVMAASVLSVMVAMSGPGAGLMLTLLAIGGWGLLLTFMSSCCQSRRRRASFGGLPGKICFAIGILYSAHHTNILVEAAKDYEPGGVPMPTDLELWMAGQQTLAEQLAEAAQRFVDDLPLFHNRAEAPPREYTVTPPALIGEPVPPTLEELNLHVTVWIAAVYCESEIVDLELPRPLSLAYMKEALVDTCTVIPEQYDDLSPTIPQLGDYYGSFIAQPAWLRDSAKKVLVIDTRALGGTAYAVYFDGRVNHAGIRNNLPEYQEEQLDFYLYGSLTPLAPGHSMAAVTGGVIKVVLQGRYCTWSDALDVRMEQPDRWSSEVDPPTQLDGLHNVFQSTQDQVVDEIEPLDFRSLEVVAAEVLELNPEEITVYLPEERLQALSHGGRTIWEQGAVVINRAMPAAEESFIIFVDLRPLACFPQWVRTPVIFDPQAYIDGLQIQGLADWVLTVTGGERAGHGQVRVRHREVLTFSLQRPSDTDEDSESGDDGDGDDSSTDSILRSGSGSPPPLAPGESPRGPPPPEACQSQQIAQARPRCE